MKTNWLVGSVILAGTMVLHAQTNDLSAALRQGLFEEEANRNLEAAISNYQALATQFDRDRQIAATAIFRLGECYRKLGRDNDAVVQYQRIVREFSDQQTLATLSQQNLTGLGVASQPRFQERLVAIIKKNSQDSIAPATPESAASAAVMEAEAASLKAQIEHLSSLKQEGRRVAVQQNYSNPVLTKLMQDLAEAELTLASLTNDYAPTDLHVTRVTALMNALNGQIDAQMNGVIEGLQAKMEADLNAAKILRDQSGPASAVPTEASPVTDDEDREIRRIQAMIQNSPDLINAPVKIGDAQLTPLGHAANNGQLRVAQFLLDSGAEVNRSRDFNSWPPLLIAASSGHKAMVELLLAKGADMNSRDGSGQTALHLAAKNGFQSVAEVLLANKADVNARDGSQSTPLHEAAVNGHADVLTRLLSAGAKPDSEDDHGRTALSYAVEKAHSDCVKALLAAKADPNAGKLDAPLFCAIHKGNANLVELLLRAGADPNRQGSLNPQIITGMMREPLFRDRSSQVFAFNPLEFSIWENQPAVVRLLLQFKADPNGKDTSGQPLTFTALLQTDILKILLDAGADPNSVHGNADEFGMHGETPLMVAARSHFSPLDPFSNPGVRRFSQSSTGDPAAAKLLLDHGANVNARRPSDGETVLHLAVPTCNRELVELILANKADVNVRNNEGKTPLDYAKANGSTGTEIVALLRQHGALDNLPNWDRIAVSRASANFSETIFQKGTNDWNQFSLLELICKFDQNDNQNNSPLAFADLAHIVVFRPVAGGATAKRIEINLLNATNGVDCAKDVPLEFGDMVEIPEREHILAEPAIYLQKDQFMTIFNYLRNKAGEAKLMVAGGQTIQLPLQPFFPGIGEVLHWHTAQGVLTSSSDLSHVKIIRRDPKSGKNNERIFDCNHTSRSSDLWLRDGDVIEVPEK